MDAAFASQTNHGGSFLSDAGQALDCVYICLWSYLPHPANCLVSTDGWLYEEKQSPGRELFDLYRRVFFDVEPGHFPGLAFKEELDYLEVDEPGFTSLVGVSSQRLFYQKAGIKMAVFISRSDGEIELGWSRSTNMEEKRERAMRLFSVRERFLNIPSARKDTTRRGEFLSLPSPKTENAALVAAFVQVLSSSPSFSSIPPRGGSAFSPYGICGESIIRLGDSVPGQRIVKRLFSIVKRIEPSKGYSRSRANYRQVISERKRRERLNQTFATLRSLLPSKLRMDRASLLGRARESINAMRERISSLEEDNRTLQVHLKTSEEPADEESSGERVEIRVNRCSKTSSSSSSFSSALSPSSTAKIELRIIVRMNVKSTRILLRILACLKKMRNVNLDSMQARNSSRHEIVLRLNILNFQTEGQEWQEASLAEAVTGAIIRELLFDE